MNGLFFGFIKVVFLWFSLADSIIGNDSHLAKLTDTLSVNIQLR